MKYLKIILAIGLILCLAEMPYGYYNLIRFSSFIIFGIMAIVAYKEKKETAFIGYIGLAILFQPFFKIALGRSLWQIIDVIVALILMVPIIKTHLNK